MSDLPMMYGWDYEGNGRWWWNHDGIELDRKADWSSKEYSDKKCNRALIQKLNSRNAFQVPLIDVASLGAIKENEDGAWNKISNAL